MHVGRQAQVFLCVICMTRHFDLLNLKDIFHVFLVPNDRARKYLPAAVDSPNLSL